MVPYPDKAINQTNENDLAATLVSVQSVVVDPSDRLWTLNTGSPMSPANQVRWAETGLRRFNYR